VGPPATCGESTPESRRLYVCDDVGLREIASLALPEFGLAVTADVAFD
jgi:hypothetical protein